MLRTARPNDLTGDTTGLHPWTNRLAQATSPWLRRHGHDPVDWHPWGPDVLAAARERDLPILLVVGYEACHACRVAQRERWSDPELAAQINAAVVPVLVDRDARPDVDALAMEALLVIQGQAGWPALLFLLPDGRPFTGSTWSQADDAIEPALESVQALWREERDQIEAAGAALLEQLRAPGEPGEIDLERAVQQLIGLHDPQFGGFGDDAKFPQPAENAFLLLAALKSPLGSRLREPALRAVRRNLEELDRRAIQDPLHGGFFRASVDRAWSTPQLEKLLVDNALLLRLHARAGAALAPEPSSRRAFQVARDTARYLWSRLAHPDGGFYASEGGDDTVGRAFHRWSAHEVREALGEASPTELPLGVPLSGAFTFPSALGGQPSRPVREALAAHRLAVRPAPELDRRRIVAWNGHALGAFAEAGRLLGDPAWVQIAADTATLLLDARLPDGRLPRILGGDEPGFLDDHAAVTEGLLALYQARPWERRWLDAAWELAALTLVTFGTPLGPVQSTAPELPLHRHPWTDDAEPSAAGLLAEALRQLLAYGAPLDPSALDELLRAATPTLRALPAATSTLHGVAWARAPWAKPLHLVISGPVDDPIVVQMLRVWDRAWRPHGTVAVVPPGAEIGAFRGLVDPEATTQPCAWLRRGADWDPRLDTVEALERALG